MHPITPLALDCFPFFGNRSDAFMFPHAAVLRKLHSDLGKLEVIPIRRPGYDFLIDRTYDRSP